MTWSLVRKFKCTAHTACLRYGSRLRTAFLSLPAPALRPCASFADKGWFSESEEDRSEGRHIWLVYGTRYETELYYQKYFEGIAAERHNFHYLSSLSRPHEDWEGLRGYVQDHVAEIVKKRARENHFAPVPTAAEPVGFGIHAYICGLNEMVSGNRERLIELGWQKKQVIFERYD